MEIAAALKKHVGSIVAPRLRESGFTGSYPNWRRIHSDGVDLVSFQVFLRSVVGARFCVEYGFTSPFVPFQIAAKTISPENITTAPLKFSARRRLNPETLGPEAVALDYWYEIVEDQPVEPQLIARCNQVLADLHIADTWWSYMTEKEQTNPSPPAFMKKVERA